MSKQNLISMVALTALIMKPHPDKPRRIIKPNERFEVDERDAAEMITAGTAEIHDPVKVAQRKAAEAAAAVEAANAAKAEAEAHLAKLNADVAAAREATPADQGKGKGKVKTAKPAAPVQEGDLPPVQ